MLSEEKFIQTLKDQKVETYIEGEITTCPIDHPLVRPSTNSIAMSYRLAEGTEHEPLMTEKSHITGKKINRFTHIQQNVNDLLSKVKMQRLMGQKTASCFQRCAGLDCLNSVYAVTHDIDKDFGTDYHKRFLDFLVHIQEEDLVVAAAMTDPKGDRSLSPCEQKDPDQFLRIVDETDDGIIINGAKFHITGCTNSHYIMFMPTRAMGEVVHRDQVFYSIKLRALIKMNLFYGYDIWK